MKDWFGTLAIDNCEEVANMIYELLKDKTYTFVSANEYFGYKPEVRTNQKLHGDNPKTWVRSEDAGFNFEDAYSVWGLSTSQKEAGYDPKFNAPYIVIEYSKITITHKAPSGNKLYWVIAIQE